MPAPPVQELVGRAAELTAADAALAELEGGRFAALAILGEPGIGKTSLLAALGARADERGYLVLSGSASEFERDLPFWVYEDALDDYVRALEPRRLDALDDDVRAELGYLLPSLAQADATDGAGPDHRFRTHRAVRSLLEALATPKPLVLMLDDVHWADSGSIELLGALLRRPPAAPVLIAVASRPRQTPEQLWGALERARAAGTLQRVEVGALSPSDARMVLGDEVSDATAAALYETASGNPFYLRQLARAGQRASRPAEAGAGAFDEIGVPQRVVDAIKAELAGLDATARSVLEGAAVAGDPFEPELAASAAGVPEEVATEALDALLARDVVRETDVPRRFRFRHPLVRSAVYEAAPGGWRLLAHGRCADALARRGAPAAARAHHVEHAARHGDAEAVAVLREAGEAVAQRTPAGAARWFAAALRLLPADAAPAERVGLLGARAGALAASGEFADAHAALLEAVEVAQDLGTVRGQLIAACAAVDQLLGRHEEARLRLEAALRALGDEDTEEHVALCVALAENAVFLQDYPTAYAHATRAYEIATRLGEDLPLALGAGIVAVTGAFIGQVELALQRREEAARIVKAMPDADLAQRVIALAHLFSAELYLDRFEQGAAHAERAVALARATAQQELFPPLVPMLASFLVMLGRLKEAVEHDEAAIEAARLTGNEQALAWALFHRAFAALHVGDLDIAFATATESVELTRGGGVSVVASYAGMILGVAVAYRGDPGDGADMIIASAGGPSLPHVPGAWRAYYLERLTEVLLAAGRREDAERAAEDAARIAEATGLHLPAMAARRAAARVAFESDPATAAALALASAEAAERIASPVEAAVSRALAGAALARAGDEATAAAELERAARELDELGAQRHRDAAEHELRRLGRRHPQRRRGGGRSDGTGIESLSDRELEIARMVVDRKTNAQIAAELFLSIKTVETHIRHLFEKLGVSSRVDVARAVERAERQS